ncbi:MAG TPA: hypothetical protein VFA98_02810 [Thermoanaerobaculia bacterium]|nr:hypothetical protein [Thermoanaerobaculia bacterium]
MRRLEACPAHEVPGSFTGVAQHHHPDPSRIGVLATREKNCKPSEIEAREAEYARVMGRVKAFLENAPS